MTARLIRRVAPPQDRSVVRVRPAMVTTRRIMPPPAVRSSVQAATVLRFGTAPQIDIQTQPTTVMSAALPAAAAARLHTTDLATGRGLTYEWEQFVADILDRLDAVENDSYLHTQIAPAATWTMTHGLGTKPSVTIVADDGSELYAEVDYPDDQTVVITFGQPYSGVAYLRG